MRASLVRCTREINLRSQLTVVCSVWWLRVHLHPLIIHFISTNMEFCYKKNKNLLLEKGLKNYVSYSLPYKWWCFMFVNVYVCWSICILITLTEAAPMLEWCFRPCLEMVYSYIVKFDSMYVTMLWANPNRSSTFVMTIIIKKFVLFVRTVSHWCSARYRYYTSVIT